MTSSAPPPPFNDPCSTGPAGEEGEVDMMDGTLERFQEVEASTTQERVGSVRGKGGKEVGSGAGELDGATHSSSTSLILH